MVDGINAGFSPLQGQNNLNVNKSPGEALRSLKNDLSGPPTNAATQTTQQPNQTEEIASQTTLSRDVSRPNPNDPFASNNARGSVLDISV